MLRPLRLSGYGASTNMNTAVTAKNLRSGNILHFLVFGRVEGLSLAHG